MRIAILAWGSLIWDPRELEVTEPFVATGPVLPIEFCRISADGRITLVIDTEIGAGCTTYHAVSKFSDLSSAAENLRLREGMPSNRNIGGLDLHSRAILGAAQPAKIVEAIGEWGRSNRYDAIVWTALRRKFKDDIGKPFSVGNALDYLGTLSGEKQRRAFEYIRNAPSEIRTPLREAFDRRWPGGR